MPLKVNASSLDDNGMSNDDEAPFSATASFQNEVVDRDGEEEENPMDESSEEGGGEEAAAVALAEEEAGDAAEETGTEKVDPRERFGRPHLPKVTFDKLKFYEPDEIVAPRMYNRNATKPIVLSCMGFGVPGFPDVETDEILAKGYKRSKGGLYNKSDILPSVKQCSKPYLLKEVMRRTWLDEELQNKPPKPANWTTQALIDWLKIHAPRRSEHKFILDQMAALKAEVEEHFTSHSCTSQATLNRAMRFIECVLHPSIRKDWKDRDMQKVRPVLDAECSNSDQLETNEDFISFWEKGSDLYNDPNQSFKSRVFKDEYGKPFDKSITIHPVSEEFHMQPSTFRQKYIEKRGDIDKIRRNLGLSGEGQGSRSGYTVKSAAAKDGDAYMYLALDSEDQLKEFCLSMDKKHAGGMSGAPLTRGHKSPKKSATSTPSSGSSAGVTAIDRLVTTISNFGRTAKTSDRIRDCQELLLNLEESLLNHRSKLSDFADKYAQSEEMLVSGAITEGHILYKARKKAYDACEQQIAVLEERIDQTKEEIKSIKTEMESAEDADDAIDDQSDGIDSEFNDDYATKDPFPDDDQVTPHKGVNINEPLGDEDIHDAEDFDN